MFKVNEYFDGKVKSIAFTTNGIPATVGVMAKGEYTFGTSTIEHMTVIRGKGKVKLPGDTVFRDIMVGETFVVAANVKFSVVVEEETAYLCLYR